LIENTEWLKSWPSFVADSGAQKFPGVNLSTLASLPSLHGFMAKTFQSQILCHTDGLPIGMDCNSFLNKLLAFGQTFLHKLACRQTRLSSSCNLLSGKMDPVHDSQSKKSVTLSPPDALIGGHLVFIVQCHHASLTQQNRLKWSPDLTVTPILGQHHARQIIFPWLMEEERHNIGDESALCYLLSRECGTVLLSPTALFSTNIMVCIFFS
jgi:hypothetical protein